MSRVDLLGAYVAGDTWLHRTPVGAKLLGLAGAGVVAALLPGAVAGLVLLAVGLVLLAWSGASVRRTLLGLRTLALLLAGVAVFHLWQSGWPRAVEVVGELLGLVLLATVVTVTTPVDALLDTLTRALRPFRRFGVDPDAVALAFSLMLRAIPGTLALAEESRQAALARGLERDPRARLVPLVLRLVAHARATGDALHARGIGD